MSTISRDQVRAIAKLARLQLTKDEQELFAGQLSSILAYVEKLNGVATDNVAPTNQVTDQVNVARRDGVTAAPDDVRQAILSLAPERDGDGFKVKTVLKQ